MADAAIENTPETPPPPPRPSGGNRRVLVRWIKRVLMAMFLVAVAGMVVVAWLPKPIPVETALASEGELEVTVNEDGRTRVKDRYIVSAPLSGSLARIELHAGDEIEPGDVLARIVPVEAPLLDTRSRKQAEAQVAAAKAGQRQAKAQIERAKAAVSLANETAERTEGLAEQGIESRAALDQALADQRGRGAELTSARFAAKVADYELEVAKATLGRMSRKRSSDVGEQLEVTSPIGGRILKVIQESEGVVQAGIPLVELGDPAALEIVVDVLTRDATKIERGAHASVERWGGDPLVANVRLVEPSAFTRISALGVEEQRVNAILDLDEPYERWAALGDGYRVETRITVWRADNVLKIPASALFRHDEGWAVFAIREQTAVLQVVEVGRRNGLEAHIESGLSAGDRIVQHPSDRVTDGTSVTWR